MSLCICISDAASGCHPGFIYILCKEQVIHIEIEYSYLGFRDESLPQPICSEEPGGCQEPLLESNIAMLLVLCENNHDCTIPIGQEYNGEVCSATKTDYELITYTCTEGNKLLIITYLFYKINFLNILLILKDDSNFIIQIMSYVVT